MRIRRVSISPGHVSKARRHSLPAHHSSVDARFRYSTRTYQDLAMIAAFLTTLSQLTIIESKLIPHSHLTQSPTLLPESLLAHFFAACCDIRGTKRILQLNRQGEGLVSAREIESPYSGDKREAIRTMDVQNISNIGQQMR